MRRCGSAGSPTQLTARVELTEKLAVSPAMSFAAVLNDAAIDAIVIGVPNRFHHPLSPRGDRRRKDLLLEKPMALTAAQCAEINDVAPRGLVASCRSASSIATRPSGKLRGKSSTKGRLGHIYHAKAHLHIRRGVPGLGKWFTTKVGRRQGGALIDVGVHLIDLALSTLGYPEVADVSGQVYSTFGRRMRGYVYENMWAGPPDWDGVCDVEDAAHAFRTLPQRGDARTRRRLGREFPRDMRSQPSLMGFFGDAGGMTFELFGDHADADFEPRRRGSSTSDSKRPPPSRFATSLPISLRSLETRRLTGRQRPSQGEAVQRIVDEDLPEQPRRSQPPPKRSRRAS